MAKVAIHRKMPADKPGSSSARFKYQRLVGQLEREIRERYAPGERIESELDLCARLKLNRDTVHKAISCLENRGLVVCKGRAGTYVADFTEKGFDSRLIATAMAIRNHVWDQLFIAVSNCSIEADRFCLICDFTGVNTDNPFAERLPLPAMAERLRSFLRFRPRTLVTDLAQGEAQVLGDIREMRWNFRNLILLNQPRLPGLPHVVCVQADRHDAWRLMGRSARQAGYRRVALFVPPPAPDARWAQVRADLAAESCGGFHVEPQAQFMEHDPQWPAKLVQFVKAERTPVAVLCDYDWGGHLVKQAVQQAGLQVPAQVGIYGMNNTGWSIQDNLTTVAFPPELWAKEILAADADLDRADNVADRLIPPVLVQRGSSLPVSG